MIPAALEYRPRVEYRLLHRWALHPTLHGAPHQQTREECFTRNQVALPRIHHTPLHGHRAEAAFTQATQLAARRQAVPRKACLELRPTFHHKIANVGKHLGDHSPFRQSYTTRIQEALTTLREALTTLREALTTLREAFTTLQVVQQPHDRR
jgi:hypothetical protein